MRLAYDNIPAQHRAPYRFSGWVSREVDGVLQETNVKTRTNGVLVWVWPDSVPAEWVTE